VLDELLTPWRAAWAPWLRGLEASSARLGLAPLAGLAGALADDLELGGPPSVPLAQAVARAARRPIAAETIHEGPFSRLVLIAPGNGRGGGRTLLVAPCSGYAAAVLAELALVLLERGELAVLEWHDARLVPAAAGPFGAADQAALAGEAIARTGPDLVVAVSQSGDAALAATLAARGADPRDAPRGLVLLGAPVVPEVGRTALQQALASLPPATLAAACLTRVGRGFPGEGRLVFPGTHQLRTVAAAEPWLYGTVRLGALVERLDGREGPWRRALGDLHAIQDVPGELWLDLVGRLRGAGAPLSEEAWAAARGLALLTVEAGADALVGPGQTHALHDRLGPSRAPRARLTLERAGHHDLFVGPLFLGNLAPALLGFAGELAGRGVRPVGG
jgi:poly(3-hydroxybutyrate) depolymerase